MVKEFIKLNKKFLSKLSLNIAGIFIVILIIILPILIPSSIASNNKIKDYSKNKITDLKVPFTPQAPKGDWQDERQQDGCEEASALMAIRWIENKSLNTETALKEILAISDFEQKKYGEYRDITLTDIIDHIFKGYFKYDKVSFKKNITTKDIINEIKLGHLVLSPMDGQKLNNPYFKAPGPERHMIVIRGYDETTKEFITNDPGTKRGQAYRYKEDVLFKAIRVYKTGYHVPINKIEKNIIIVEK